MAEARTQTGLADFAADGFLGLRVYRFDSRQAGLSDVGEMAVRGTSSSLANAAHRLVSTPPAGGRVIGHARRRQDVQAGTTLLSYLLDQDGVTVALFWGGRLRAASDIQITDAALVSCRANERRSWSAQPGHRRPS